MNACVEMPPCVAHGCCNKSYRKMKNQRNIEENVEVTFHRQITQMLKIFKIPRLYVLSTSETVHNNDLTTIIFQSVTATFQQIARGIPGEISIRNSSDDLTGLL